MPPETYFKLREDAKKALERYVAQQPQTYLTRSPNKAELTQVWLDGYTQCLYDLGIDAEDQVFKQEE